MATNYSEDAALIAKVQAEIDADPELYLTKTHPLTQDDLVLIGTVVQIYGYADLNARRIIDHLRRASLGPDKQNAGLLQDAQVYNKLVEVAETLPESPLRTGLINAAKTFDMHHTHRHNFAHWAARRASEHDLMVIYSYNAREAERRLGQRSEPEHLIYGVVPLRPIRAELKGLQNHADNLAKNAAFIFVHFDKFKQHFDDLKKAERDAKYEAGKTKRGAKGLPKGS